MSSFPAAYFLTPNEGEFFLQGQLTTLPLKKTETWKAQGWGAWQWPDKISRECETRLSHLLSESKAFYEKLAPGDTHLEQKTVPEHASATGFDSRKLEPASQSASIRSAEKKITVVIATGYKTLDRGFWDEPRPRFKAHGRGEKNAQLFVDGDGTLSTQTQTPHPWFIEQGWVEVLRIKGEHLEALAHPEVRALYRSWK